MGSGAIRILASGLAPVCVSDSCGLDIPTGHPNNTTARARVS